MDTLDEASDDAINMRKIAYNAYIRPAIQAEDQAEGLNRIDPERINLSGIDFTRLKADLNHTLQPDITALIALEMQIASEPKLASTWHGSASARKAALKVVNQLAVTLELVMKAEIKAATALEQASQ
jgi:hypothetical protein